MPSLPYNKSERQFRFYEAPIAKVIANDPKHTIFDPLAFKVSLETFRARFRDSFTSYIENNWKSDLIDRQRAEEFYPHLRVSCSRGVVICGTRQAVNAYLSGPQDFDSPGHTALADITIDVPLAAWPEFRMICLLAHMRAFKAPLRIPLAHVPADWLTLANDSFDIDIQLSGNFYIIN